MILDRLAKFDESKRISAVILTITAAATVSYFAIARNSVIKLQDAQAGYTEMRTAYRETEKLLPELPKLQDELTKAQKELQERQSQYFSRSEALLFLESINSICVLHNLKPASRVISEPGEIDFGKTNGKKNDLQVSSLKTQSIKIAISGNYFDIVDFIEELTDCPQKVRLENLNITLPAGENFNPKASFEIVLITDLLKDAKK